MAPAARIGSLGLGALSIIVSSCGAPSESPVEVVVSVSTTKPEPAATSTKGLRLVTNKSEVRFIMHAPLEIQRASFTGEALRGGLDFITPASGPAKGFVHVDLSKLEIQQSRLTDEDRFGDFVIDGIQNLHARHWLEIGDKISEPKRTQNSRAEVQLQTITVEDVDSGHAILATIDAHLLIHGVSRSRRVALRVERRTENGRTELHVTTREPMRVDLADFDIAPRDETGALAAKSLQALAPKVAPFANVEVDLYFRDHSD